MVTLIPREIVPTQRHAPASFTHQTVAHELGQERIAARHLDITQVTREARPTQRPLAQRRHDAPADLSIGSAEGGLGS